MRRPGMEERKARCWRIEWRSKIFLSCIREKRTVHSIPFKLIYDGVGPLKWSGDANAFGLQDKSGVLSHGSAGERGTVIFDFSLQVKSEDTSAPVFAGTFANGPPASRFLYLSWRNNQGGFDQRLKLPLSTITWDDVRQAVTRGAPLVGELIDHHPRLTSTGENIGGSRPISWKLK